MAADGCLPWLLQPIQSWPCTGYVQCVFFSLHTLHRAFCLFLPSFLNYSFLSSCVQRHIMQRRSVVNRISCKNVKSVSIWTCGRVFFQMAYLSPSYPCHRERHLGQWGEGGKACCPIVIHTVAPYISLNCFAFFLQWVCDVPGAVKRNKGVVYRWNT